MNGGILLAGLVVALVAVPWLIHAIINNIFDKGEKALKNRRQASEVERIRQQVQVQRRRNE